MATDASLKTRENSILSKPTENIFESLVIIGKRARQISSIQKEELNGKLAEFASNIDNLEKIFENREQIEISKFYERMPKPTTTATEEFLNDEVIFRRRDEDDAEGIKL